MEKKLYILLVLVLSSFSCYSQKIEFNLGLSNQTGTSTPHFSYGFLSDLDFRITKKICISSGVEVNVIKYTLNGMVFNDPGYWGNFSIDHNYAFYNIPVIVSYRFCTLGKLNINARAGILNSIIYDYYTGNPDSYGKFTKGIKKGSFLLIGHIGISLDYPVSEKSGIFLNEQFLGSQYYTAGSDKTYLNTQLGVKFRIK